MDSGETADERKKVICLIVSAAKGGPLGSRCLDGMVGISKKSRKNPQYLSHGVTSEKRLARLGEQESGLIFPSDAGSNLLLTVRKLLWGTIPTKKAK